MVCGCGLGVCGFRLLVDDCVYGVIWSFLLVVYGYWWCGFVGCGPGCCLFMVLHCVLFMLLDGVCIFVVFGIWMGCG